MPPHGLRIAPLRHDAVHLNFCIVDGRQTDRAGPHLIEEVFKEEVRRICDKDRIVLGIRIAEYGVAQFDVKDIFDDQTAGACADQLFDRVLDQIRIVLGIQQRGDFEFIAAECRIPVFAF